MLSLVVRCLSSAVRCVLLLVFEVVAVCCVLFVVGVRCGLLFDAVVCLLLLVLVALLVVVCCLLTAVCVRCYCWLLLVVCCSLLLVVSFGVLFGVWWLLCVALSCCVL